MNYPTTSAAVEGMRLQEAFRCFDRNEGRSFDLPKTDPHGYPLTLLDREELLARKGWCMLPEYHKALMGEFKRRAGLPNYYQPANF
jgi:hypothetical protein